MGISGVAFILLCSTPTLPQEVVVAQLGPTAQGIEPLVHNFEQANPGHTLAWNSACVHFQAEQTTVAFVQTGAGIVSINNTTIDFSVGDVYCLSKGDQVQFNPAAGVLFFTLPENFSKNPPSVIRPDWDENITDMPGGCATEGDAYRRILLTWQGKNGPYLSHQINVHRVRIHDSFTHYHPKVGGFDEFYLVQEAPPGARLIVSENLASILNPKGLTAKLIPKLLREIPLKVNQLVYLPRGTIHRGVGGAVVQVITTPGFIPDAEISVDKNLAEINKIFQLKGDRALPVHLGPNFVQLTQQKNGNLEVRIGGKPFTTQRFDRRIPDLWPLRNADGIAVTRSWPRQVVVGEKQDHPHHQSVWFSHGDISGMDFWHDSTLKISANGVTKFQSGQDKGWWRNQFTWMDQNGKSIAEEIRQTTAFVNVKARGLDFDIVMHAKDRGFVFGDTKEGSFAVRLATGLVADQGGELINSEGHRGKEAWGKKARWVMAQGMLEGKSAALVIAGHHNNLRHPTTWHARTYGLVAANPFGLHDFHKNPEGSGMVEISAGDAIRMRYRVLVFTHHPSAEEIEGLLKGFSSAPKL